MRLKRTFEGYSFFLLDCDGVVWRGDVPIGTAITAIKELEKAGKIVAFLTNNSSLTRRSYVAKLSGMGLSVSVERIFTSSYATALLLSPKGGKAFVVGEEGIAEELESQGISVVEKGWADYVVVGIDRSFSYWKLAKAMRLIRGGAIFVATNTDKTIPSREGELPGAGAMVSAVEACAGRPPDVVVGKPERTIFEIALGELGADPREVLVIGDRLETDIAGARNMGIDSALVLTGVATREDIRCSDHKPKYVLNTLRDMFED